MTTNDASEGLPRTMLGSGLAAFLRGLLPETTQFDHQIADIEAEASRATVERIRAAVVAKSGAYNWTADEASVGAEVHDTLFAILDAEAAR